ncbi:MAG: metal ABC transporter ATP-binding protein [Spirochaetia bacterium]
MNSQPVIIYENVRFGYTNTPVVEEISFTVSSGELVSIIGPNGGGKTTLLKLSLGLITPDAGKIRILGTTPKKARENIGYVTQYMHYDPAFPATVLDVVLLGRLNSGFSIGFSKEDKETAINAVEQVGLCGLQHRSFSDLSGGQRQRVLIARALATKAEVLFLDEPTNNLDRKAEEEIYTLLTDLKKEHTILLVSHDIGVVPSISDKIVCLNTQAVIHKGSELTGEQLQNIYATTMSRVDHHQHVEQG